MKKREFNALVSQYFRVQAEHWARLAIAEQPELTEQDEPGEPVPQIPPELVQKIAIAEHKARQKRRVGKLRQITAGALVVFTVVSFTVQPVRASWQTLFQHFGEIYDKYIILRFDEAEEQASAEMINNRIYEKYHSIYLPKWVPADYTVDVIRQGDDYCKITYYSQDTSGEVIFIRSTSATHVDNEMENPETFYANGQEYIWGEKADEGLRWLVWQTQTDVFTLQADLNTDELLKIAQSVVFQK